MKKIFIFLSMVILTFVCFAVFNKVSYSNDDLGEQTYNKKEEKQTEENTNKDSNGRRIRQDDIDREKREQQNGTEQKEKNSYSQIKTISFTEFEKLVAGNNSFVIIVSSSACSHCLNYEPVVNKVLKDLNETIYRLDILSMTVPDKDKLNEYYTVSGTPTVRAFSN